MTARTDTPPALTAVDQRFLTELASQLRADSIRCSPRTSERLKEGHSR